MSRCIYAYVYNKCISPFFNCMYCLLGFFLTGLRQSTQLAYHCFLNLCSSIKLLNQCIDHLQFWFYLFVKHETREKNAHFVQYVHCWSQNLKYTCTCTWLCKCNTRRHGDLSLLSCFNRNRLTWSWPICCLLWGSLLLCTCFWSTSVLV